MIALQKGETVLAKARKHWFIFALDVMMLVIALFVPPVLYQVFASPLSTPLLSEAAGSTTVLSALLQPSYLVFGYLVWVLVIWFLMVAAWTSYYLDIWIVTSERLYAIDQVALFHRQVSILTLERIQDINVEVPGILGMFIGFGNMTVETAGAQVNFKITGISNPSACKDMIIQAQERNRATTQPAQAV